MFAVLEQQFVQQLAHANSNTYTHRHAVNANSNAYTHRHAVNANSNAYTHAIVQQFVKQFVKLVSYY